MIFMIVSIVLQLHQKFNDKKLICIMVYDKT